MIEELRRQRVLNFLDAFYSGDINGALACCSDDVDFLAHGPIDLLPNMGHREGKAELAAIWRVIDDHYSEIRYEIPLVVAEKNEVAAIVRLFFRKRSNGRMVQFDTADFYTLREGRIAQIRQFLDSFDLVQQALERDLVADLARLPPPKA